MVLAHRGEALYQVCSPKAYTGGHGCLFRSAPRAGGWQARYTGTTVLVRAGADRQRMLAMARYPRRATQACMPPRRLLAPRKSNRSRSMATAKRLRTPAAQYATVGRSTLQLSSMLNAQAAKAARRC
jgi:hypothetical protein